MHTGVHTSLASHSLCGCPAERSHSPAARSLGPGAMAQLPSVCTTALVLPMPAKAPATLPCSPVGGLGAGCTLVHSLPQALCRVLVQHSPWACTMPAELVPQREEWHSGHIPC